MKLEYMSVTEYGGHGMYSMTIKALDAKDAVKKLLIADSNAFDIRHVA